MNFDTIKALHIIFVISWFAGLLYIVRLFIYHREAQEKGEEAKKVLSAQFEIMEKRLWWIITTPAMVLSLIFGIWMLFEHSFLIKMPWMHIKLTFIAVLLFYHFMCQRILNQFKKGIFNWSSNQLRLWNELATLCLVAVVFIVIKKQTMSWLYGTIGFFAVAIGLMLLFKIYKRIRTKNN